LISASVELVWEMDDLVAFAVAFTVRDYLLAFAVALTDRAVVAYLVALAVALTDKA
jgi:hypothetical protein